MPLLSSLLVNFPNAQLEIGMPGERYELRSRDTRRSSVRFVRFIGDPCLIRNPIHFPSLASIIRERLLKVGRIRGCVRPNESNKNRFVIQCVLAEKLAVPVLELASLGCDHGSVLAVGPVKAPLVSLGIVQTEGQTFDVAGGRAIGFELLDLSAAIPDLSGNGRAVKFDPR